MGNRRVRKKIETCTYTIGASKHERKKEPYHQHEHVTHTQTYQIQYVHYVFSFVTCLSMYIYILVVCSSSSFLLLSGGKSVGIDLLMCYSNKLLYAKLNIYVWNSSVLHMRWWHWIHWIDNFLPTTQSIEYFLFKCMYSTAVWFMFELL